MFFYSVRGAVTIEENSAQQIYDATHELLTAIMAKNNLQISDITQIIFSATKDITKAYPAVAARKMGINQASLFCVQEMYVEDSLPMCIRVLLNFNAEPGREIFHVYLGKTKALRPDLN